MVTINCILTLEWYLDIRKLLYIALCLTCTLGARVKIDPNLHAWFFTPKLSDLDIIDWKNPTKDDYWKVQHHLESKRRGLLDSEIRDRPFKNDFLNKTFYGWASYRMGRLRLVSDAVDPIRVVECFGNDPNQRDECVICYAGYPKQGAIDRDYKQGIEYIKQSLTHFGFKGHFIYYIGGWPGAQRERLKYADVPYSFKPFMFEEIRDLGYKNVLWVDSCVLPVKSLKPVFDHIRTSGMCFYSSGSNHRWYEMTDGINEILPLNLKVNSNQYIETVSSVVGFNFDNANANNLLSKWVNMAEMKVPFLQSDEPPFMFLVNCLGLTNKRVPYSYYVNSPNNTGDFKYWERNSKAILYHQYDIINPNYKLPHDIFNH